MTQNLFYSHEEKILFLITGYGETNVKSLISTLQNNYNYINRISGGVKEISTDEIQVSRRYKGMRYFWCKTNVVPTEAFVIGKGEHKWTMHQWLTS